MNPKHLKIAAIQMVSTTRFDDNLEMAKSLIVEASKQGASLVVLPEYFALMGLRESDKFEYVEKHNSGSMQSMLKELTKQLNIWIVAGTHPIESDDVKRPYGRCYVFNNSGEVVTWYDKIHLFDVNIDDQKKNYCESKYSMPGDAVVSFESPWGKIGLAVCYDLRFPELFRRLLEMDCKIFLLPAAFTFKTGEAHWEILIKARAVENLCYFVTSAQGGLHENGRETWGHSMIVSPWGTVLAELSSGSGYILSDIDLQEQSKIRKEFPVLSHKKL